MSLCAFCEKPIKSDQQSSIHPAYGELHNDCFDKLDIAYLLWRHDQHPPSPGVDSDETDD